MSLYESADAAPLPLMAVPDLVMGSSVPSVSSGTSGPSAEVLVAEHFVPIYGYLARRVGPDLAEDLAAEVFARALADRDRFDPALGTWRMWLFGIATNLVAKHRRAERRRLSAYAKADSRAIASGRGTDSATDDADDRLSAENRLRALASALKRLNGAQRDALYLVGVAELTYEEAAAVLAVPIGTVRSRVSRARTELRLHVERSGQP
jgi:RNA polymerase sigma factor (sigma-70 family)